METDQEDDEGVYDQWTQNSQKYNNLLEKVLQESDDIECTAISVFNLLKTIIKHPKFDSKDFINLDSALPFNFHRVDQVRLSFTILMKQVIQVEVHNYENKNKLKLLAPDVLQKLFIIGLQSTLIEKKDSIVKKWLFIIQHI